jgi:hypothetical protein
MENPRQRTEGKSEVFHSINNALAVGTQVSSPIREPGLAHYLIYLRTLKAQFGGDPVSNHFVGSAARSYHAFCLSGNPLYGSSAWNAIHPALQLFSQQPERN